MSDSLLLSREDCERLIRLYDEGNLSESHRPAVPYARTAILYIEQHNRVAAELDSQRERDRRDRLQAAADLLSRRGYRPCDIPACNCGSWHAPETPEGVNLRERAERAEQLANHWYEAAHQFEQELARERERAEKWKEVAQMFEDAHGTGLKSIYGAARDSFVQLLAADPPPDAGREDK